jgi:hypothetical protein
MVLIFVVRKVSLKQHKGHKNYGSAAMYFLPSIKSRGTFKKKKEYIDFHTSQLKELAPESSLFSVFVGPCCSQDHLELRFDRALAKTLFVSLCSPDSYAVVLNNILENKHPDVTLEEIQI